MSAGGRPGTDVEPDDEFDGYGPGWEAVRERVLERDGYRCRRCGYHRPPDVEVRFGRALQAHHLVPRAAGGPDHPENLVTLCRPCHGVQHPHNDSFDDSRPDADEFPLRSAPDPVARMRRPELHYCARCRRYVAEPARLYRLGELSACAPCAGALLAADAAAVDDLRANHLPDGDRLREARFDTPVRPTLGAPEPVAVRRPPTTAWERHVADTPLRFLVRPWLLVAVLVVGALALAVLL